MRPRRSIGPALLACSSALTLASCGGGNTATKPDRAPSRLAIGETGVGPIDDTVPVSVKLMRTLLPGYDVKVVYPDGSKPNPIPDPLFDPSPGVGPSPYLQISAGGETLLAVYPDFYGNVRQVLVVSARVPSQTRWHVGDQLTDPSQLASCQCIDLGLTCFTKDSHVEIIFDWDCETLLANTLFNEDPQASDELRRLEEGIPDGHANLKGRTIKLLRWTPRAFGSPRPHAPPPRD